MSAEWHERYTQGSRNRAVAMLVESLHGSCSCRSTVCAREPAPLHGRKDLEEHRALVDAVAAATCSGLQELVRTDLPRTTERLA